VTTRDLPITAADMATLMEAIIRGHGVDPAWREDMVGLLLRQETRDGVPALLPEEARTGNKTGTWPNATHDVAFVDAPGGLYVIAILSDRGWEWDPIARVSRAVYDVLAR
jgi:beta-lactamase class A